MKNDIADLASPDLRAISEYVPGKPVEELQRELGLSEVTKMASNENPLGPSDAVLTALQSALPGVSMYPDGASHDLKQALSEKHGCLQEQVVIGNGSNEIFELLARVFLSPGQEVIFSEHGFAMYSLVTQVAGATPVPVNDRNWVHDLDAMEEAITERTRMIFLANPNNPTGTWFSKGELKAFLKSVPENILVVVDEAYFDYVDQENYDSALIYLNQFENLIVTRTFSKIYGLGGLRLGYALAGSVICGLLEKARQPFNINLMAQVAGLAALDDKEFYLKSIEQNALGRAQLQAGLETLDLDYIPSVTNFIAVEFGEKAFTIYRELLKRGYIIRPLSSYGMSEYLRITIGTEEQNLGFLTTLKDVLDQI